VERSGSGDDKTGMRNVLLIVVDCLRADRIIGPRSCQTPVLDQLGSSAAVYAQGSLRHRSPRQPMTRPLTTPLSRLPDRRGSRIRAGGLGSKEGSGAGGSTTLSPAPTS